MEVQPQAPPIPAPAPPVPPAAPAPAPPLPPVATPAPAEGNYAGGGFLGLGKLDWVEVTFLALACTAIFLIIDYRRKVAKREITEMADLKKDVYEVKRNLVGIEKKLTAKRRPQY